MNQGPTFPFSNLLTLFLQLTSHRSPVSPWLPIRFRKTDASVPLPPIVPVQTVTLYLITAAQTQSWRIFGFGEGQGEVGRYHVRGSGSGTISPQAGSSLTTSLSSSFVSSQRSHGKLYFSFVKVFIRVAWFGKQKVGITRRVKINQLTNATLIAHPTEVPPCERIPPLMPETDFGQLSQIGQLNLSGHIAILKDSQQGSMFIKWECE